MFEAPGIHSTNSLISPFNLIYHSNECSLTFMAFCTTVHVSRNDTTTQLTVVMQKKYSKINENSQEEFTNFKNATYRHNALAPPLKTTSPRSRPFTAFDWRWQKKTPWNRGHPIRGAATTRSASGSGQRWSAVSTVCGPVPSPPPPPQYTPTWGPLWDEARGVILIPIIPGAEWFHQLSCVRFHWWDLPH